MQPVKSDFKYEGYEHYVQELFILQVEQLIMLLLHIMHFLLPVEDSVQVFVPFFNCIYYK